MKWFVAIIQPHKLDDVRDALTQLGIQGLTVTEVKGYGRQKGQSEVYRGAEYQIHYIPKLKLELAISDDLEEQTIAAIAKAGQTGRIGDGKIFVIPLESALRIRTGEQGKEAL